MKRTVLSRGGRLLASMAIVLWVAALGRAQNTAAGPPQLPPPRAIPGITAPDAHRDGCVDCHTIHPEMNNLDVRFSTLIKSWNQQVPPPLLTKAQGAAPAGVTLKGQHPVLPATTYGNIPGNCLTCHSRASKLAPPFTRLIHAIHLTGGASNVFLTVYQGECTHCHKLDDATGSWSLPNAAER